MSNVRVSIENNELVVHIPLQSPTPSMSGKTLVVASTHGNIATDVEVNGKKVMLGLNAYIRK